MGIQQKEITVPKVVDVTDLNHSVWGWVDYNVYDNKYKTAKLIGQAKPTFVITMCMLKRKLIANFPRGVGKVSPMKPFRILQKQFIGTYTIKWVELEGKADNDHINVEVRLSEL